PGCALFLSVVHRSLRSPLSFPTRRSSDLIDQLQDQLVGIASAAVFSGSNWLSVDSSAAGWNAIQKVVSSFSRTGSGTIKIGTIEDRKSTRLNSSHVKISYAVFCLKKKKKK